MIGLRTHGIRIRRLRLHGDDRDYDVDFRAPDDTVRPLSVLAGAFSTGKTTILEFVDYCLGANDHPRHPEITPKALEKAVKAWRAAGKDDEAEKTLNKLKSRYPEYWQRRSTTAVP